MPTKIAPRTALVAGALAALLPATALAGDADFVTLDRADDDEAIGAQVGYHSYDEGPIQAMRFELYARHMWTDYAGGYAQFAVSHISMLGVSDETGFANGEAGVFFRFRPQDEMELFLRGGLSINEDADAFEGALPNLFTAYERLGDLPNVVPDTTWLRLSASPTIDRGAWFARADLGLDIPIGLADDLLLRASGGVGARAGRASFTAELVNVIGLSGEGGMDERALHTAAATARLRLGRAQPFVSIIVPIEDDGPEYIISTGLEVGRL